MTKTTKCVSFTAELYELIAFSNKEMNRIELYEKQIETVKLISEMFYSESISKKGELYTEWKYVSGVFYTDYDYKKARLQERKRTEEVIHECVCGESTIYTNSCLENRVVYVN